MPKMIASLFIIAPFDGLFEADDLPPLPPLLGYTYT